MRFNAALNMDVTKLKHCKMERENLFKEVKEEAEEELPEFGAGSEYGRKEREEARRRKYEKRKNKHNNSPWILKVGGKQGKKYFCDFPFYHAHWLHNLLGSKELEKAELLRIHPTMCSFKPLTALSRPFP